MAETPDGLSPSTPESVQAVAQTHEGSSVESDSNASVPCPGDGTAFVIGAAVGRAVEGRPYERSGDQPNYRPLKIFALDPSVSKLEGATALVNVPYEPLAPGPTGSIFKVADSADDQARSLSLDLEVHNILIRNGIDPSTSDERFQKQMVYAVCSTVYTAFRTALGRHLTWGFNPPEDKRTQLLIKPRAFPGNNSFYNRETGELCFGFYRNQAKEGFPGTVYACLSHDTVAHEVTHALLDGLRAHFSLPTSPDVLAFHEGFADLVAVFQHFSYEQVVRAAIRQSKGNLSRANLLTDIARQLGQTGRDTKTALRSAIDYTSQGTPGPDDNKGPKLYDSTLEAHELGSVLVVAVFEAFITVFKRKTERLVRLATGGSGHLGPGEISLDLQSALAEKASKLASQFLTMCIRAIDYCPPVDITLGEYLRAVITADSDIVPDDKWAYREAWIDAFRRHHIYPEWVEDLSEEALLWLGPAQMDPPFQIPPIQGLTFAELKFDGDPAWPADEGELKRQACVLGDIVTRKEFLSLFGLAAKGDQLLKGDEVDLPKIQSIRSSRRVGPSGQVVFDIVAEVTQRRMARVQGSDDACNFYGGATVIIDPKGGIRYVMKKNVLNNQRLQQQIDFLNKDPGGKYKDSFYGTASTKPNFFMMLHEEEEPGSENSGAALPLPDQTK
jgi:hypothetical protein